MGQAIEELFKGFAKCMPAGAPRGVMTVTYDLGLLIDAAREVRELQAQHENQKTNIRYLADRGDEAAKHIAALEDALARKSFEIQILQMTQGALKMEIDRLRAEPAKLYATGAVVKFDRDGSVSVVADAVEMHAVPA